MVPPSGLADSEHTTTRSRVFGGRVENERLAAATVLRAEREPSMQMKRGGSQMDEYHVPKGDHRSQAFDKRLCVAPNTTTVLQTTMRHFSSLLSVAQADGRRISAQLEREIRRLATRACEAGMRVFRHKARSSRCNPNATRSSSVGAHRQSGIGVVAPTEISYWGAEQRL